MTHTKSPFTPFDLSTKAQEIFAHPTVKDMLAQSGIKERLVNYLQTGSVGSLTEEDRPLVQVIVSLISTYALQTAYEKCKTDAAVQQYISFIDRMHGGEDLEQEMIALVPKLPTEFKEAVRAASTHAQEVLIGLIKAA
jgi:hypothetical protein